MVPEGDHANPGSDLRVKLESHLPASLPPDSSTAVFCFGHCFHRHRRVAGIELLVDSVAVRPAAARMPRRDLFEWIAGTAEDPEGRSYRSGFWATVPIHASAGATSVELEAQVRLEGGASVRAPLGTVSIREPERYPGELPPVSAETIAICMATYEPEPALLGPQLESLRAQTYQRWVCLISDGGSSPRRFARLLELTGDDDRFVVWRSEDRLGPYRNFERALRMVPGEAELVALCDQDDRWDADKLAVLRSALGSGQLVYCDQRRVTERGDVLRDSLWTARRNDWRNLASLLVANTVPGATALFRRGLLSLALPFPDAPGVPYHDHWLALVALAAGELRYVDRPLQDWVQHEAAVSGGAERSRAPAGSRGWRGAYFGGFEMRDVFARTLLLRCGSRLRARRRRALEWFVASARSPVAFAWLALRPLRRFVGRDETLGGESALARGVLWRWLIELAALRAERPGSRAYDASFPDPPQFEQRRLRRWRAAA